MSELIEEEYRKINNSSFKWKIDKNDRCFSSLYENVTDIDEKWLNDIKYWIEFAREGEAYRKTFLIIAEKNKYANSAAAYMLMNDKTKGIYSSELKKYVDRAVGYGDNQLVYDYAISLLKKNESLGDHYMKIAADMGNKNAQIMLLDDEESTAAVEEFQDYKLKPAPYSQELEITGMGYLLDQLGQEYADPIRIPYISDVSVRQVERCLRRICADFNIPVSVSTSSLVSGGVLNSINAKLLYNDMSKGGGLLNKKVYRALRVVHPNPPQQYCNELIVFLPDGVRFFFFFFF